jgi:hypothetical protein
MLTRTKIVTRPTIARPGSNERQPLQRGNVPPAAQPSEQAPTPDEPPQRPSRAALAARIQDASQAAAARVNARVAVPDPEPAEDDENPWDDESAEAALPAVPQPGGVPVIPPPDAGEVDPSAEGYWIRINQDRKCYYIAMLEEDIQSMEVVFKARHADFERILWEGNVPVRRIRYGIDPWTDRRELLPAPPPKGVRDSWQLSAQLHMEAPENGEKFIYLSSGKWAWGRVKRLWRDIVRQREQFPDVCLLIRLDLEDGKPRVGERPYVIPLFTPIAWTLPDGTEFDA